MKNNVSLGITLMISAIFLLSIMDGISKYLSQHYSVIAINMFRYWFFGAFLMNCKRITDFKKFDDINSRKLFRPSLGDYTINQLYVIALIYSTLSTSFFMTFAVRYKIEMIILLPLIVIVYSLYFSNSLGKESVAAAPEKLMKSRKFLYLSIIIALLFYLLLRNRCFLL